MIYNYNIGYSIFENLQNHTTKGFNTDCAEVLNAVYRILDQIITTDMTDEQKVKAIHDYLIYHAESYQVLQLILLVVQVFTHGIKYNLMANGIT